MAIEERLPPACAFAISVLQEREITRVGGYQPIKVDFRCIAATNKNLEQLVAPLFNRLYRE